MLNARNVHFPYEILTFLLIWGAKMPPESENINARSVPADPRQDRMLGAENVDFILVFVLFSHPE